MEATLIYNAMRGGKRMEGEVLLMKEGGSRAFKLAARRVKVEVATSRD